MNTREELYEDYVRRIGDQVPVVGCSRWNKLCAILAELASQRQPEAERTKCGTCNGSGKIPDSNPIYRGWRYCEECLERGRQRGKDSASHPAPAPAPDAVTTEMDAADNILAAAGCAPGDFTDEDKRRMLRVARSLLGIGGKAVG